MSVCEQILRASLVTLALIAALGAPAETDAAERCVLGELFSSDG